MEDGHNLRSGIISFIFQNGFIIRCQLPYLPARSGYFGYKLFVYGRMTVYPIIFIFLFIHGRYPFPDFFPAYFRFRLPDRNIYGRCSYNRSFRYPDNFEECVWKYLTADKLPVRPITVSEPEDEYDLKAGLPVRSVV